MISADHDVEHYLAGVVPRSGATVATATALMFNHGARTVRHTAEAVYGVFPNMIELAGAVDPDGKVSACSVTTANHVYLIGALDVALRYVTDKSRTTGRATL